MTDKTPDALLPENYMWKGECCPNPEKGWITDSRGNRLTRLGNRNAFGKIIQAHNQEIEIMYHRFTRSTPHAEAVLVLVEALQSIRLDDIFDIRMREIAGQALKHPAVVAAMSKAEGVK